MSTTATAEISEVLVRVTQWPAGERITLARLILETLDAAPATKGKKGISAEELIAILKPPSPAPSDAEVERILEEELTRENS